jgi:toxin FitB
MFLLDTNVVSELRKIRRGTANPGVADWADSVSASDLYISAITVEELERGVLLAAHRDKPQGAILRHWLDQLLIPSFRDRIIPVDAEIARRSARLQVPDPFPFRDSLIAATAIAHSLVLVTRNTSDFARSGAKLVNPWREKIS